MRFNFLTITGNFDNNEQSIKYCKNRNKCTKRKFPPVQNGLYIKWCFIFSSVVHLFFNSWPDKFDHVPFERPKFIDGPQMIFDVILLMQKL